MYMNIHMNEHLLPNAWPHHRQLCLGSRPGVSSRELLLLWQRQSWWVYGGVLASEVDRERYWETVSRALRKHFSQSDMVSSSIHCGLWEGVICLSVCFSVCLFVQHSTYTFACFIYVFISLPTYVRIYTHIHALYVFVSAHYFYMYSFIHTHICTVPAYHNTQYYVP